MSFDACPGDLIVWKKKISKHLEIVSETQVLWSSSQSEYVPIYMSLLIHVDAHKYTYLNKFGVFTLAHNDCWGHGAIVDVIKLNVPIVQSLLPK